MLPIEYDAPACQLSIILLPAMRRDSNPPNANMEIPVGQSTVIIETEYPWDGQVKITVSEGGDQPSRLGLRVPGWCQSVGIKVNGQEIDGSLQKGYVTLERIWKSGDVLEANFAMPPFLVEADPRVDSVRGCVAIQRGPIVYCLEEHDQPQEVNLLDVKIDVSEELTSRWQGNLLGGVMILEGTGYQPDRLDWFKNGLIVHSFRKAESFLRA
jgi:DUF1680 family protein